MVSNLVAGLSDENPDAGPAYLKDEATGAIPALSPNWSGASETAEPSRPSPAVHRSEASSADEKRFENKPVAHGHLKREEEATRRVRKPWTVPWFHAPMSESEVDKAHAEGGDVGGSAWFKKDQEASEWLNLFYDLAVVAVLGVFSSKHELSSASALPDFVSYYLLIVWLWTSQTHYDVHYQAEDGWHRLTKFLQVILFLYIGAASSQWSLSRLRDYTDTPGIKSTIVSAHQSAGESFLTVCIALALSRLLLAVQYGVSAILGRRQGRRVSHQLHTACSSLTSMVLAIIAIAIPAKSRGGEISKIFCLYLSLFIEMSVHVMHIWKVTRDGRPIDIEYLGRRWGAFTLVILGEGLTGLTKAFSSAIDGLNSSSGTVYSQVALAVVIVILLYCILFNRFRPEEDVSPKRFVFWETLHFGLHFTILLLLAAITNFIIILSFADGLTSAYAEYNKIIDMSMRGESPSKWNHSRLVGFIDRLGIEPGLEEEVHMLTEMSRNENVTVDSDIMAIQYLAEISYAALLQYNIEISDDTSELYSKLDKANVTVSSNETFQEERKLESAEYLTEILVNTVEEEYAGTLWLFPTAGGSLVLSSIRALLWTTPASGYSMKHVTSRLVHLIPFIVGVTLALLGLLAIGDKRFNFDTSDFYNPYYKLLSATLPLAVVIIAYMISYFGGELGLWWIARRKRRRMRRIAPSAGMDVKSNAKVKV